MSPCARRFGLLRPRNTCPRNANYLHREAGPVRDIEGLGLHYSKHCQTFHFRGDNVSAEFRLRMQTRGRFNMYCKLLTEIGLLLHTYRAPSPDTVAAQKTANPSQPDIPRGLKDDVWNVLRPLLESWATSQSCSKLLRSALL